MHFGRFRSAMFMSMVVCRSLFGGPGLSLNQVGYTPESEKYVYSSQNADSFFVVNTGSGEIVCRGKLVLWKDNDHATGIDVLRGDFSALKQPGVYRIRSSNQDSSSQFSIHDLVYHDAFMKSLKFFYFQRCGIALESQHAGPFQHSRCHSTDGIFHASSGFSGYHPAQLGWHDAGDYGKYVVNAGISAGTLLMAYEYFPDCFESDALNIPESGNGVPDILDEVRYELEWLLKMQSGDGGVHHKLTTKQFPAFIMPETDKEARYIYEKSSTATGNFVAMMAKAARVYQKSDSGFARQCLQAAEAGWNFLNTHPDMMPDGGFQNPSDTGTGEYGDWNDWDERLWAAVELYLSTGKDEYHQYYVSRYEENGIVNSPMSWQDVETLAHIGYLRGSRQGIQTNIQAKIRSSLYLFCQGLAARLETDGYCCVLTDDEYVWGSNSVVLNHAILLILAFEETGMDIFRNAALDQLHYILGANVHGISFVTGVGTISTCHPHHRPSSADGVEEPVPGMLAGGPNKYLNDPTLQALFTSSTPPALCYVDAVNSYASNEVAINWNAPLVFILGYFNDGKESSDVHTSDVEIPESIELFQNFPNPFNSTTFIRFSLPGQQSAHLTVYDIAGKEVFSRELGTLKAGSHQVSWNGCDKSGNVLSSGIYVCAIEGMEGSAFRKLTLIK